MKKIYEQIEKIIRIIGVLTFIGGLIVSFRFIWEAIDYSDVDSFLIAIGIIIGSFVSAIMIVGFSVIIEKLKKIVDNQNTILKKFDKDNNDCQIEKIVSYDDIDKQNIEFEKELYTATPSLQILDDNKKSNNKEDKKAIILAMAILAMIFLIVVGVIILV